MPTGVAAGDGFPYLIERSLPDVSITNAAVVGHGLTDYVSVIKHLDRAIYDGIFIAICLNDISRRDFAPGQKAQIADRETYAPWYIGVLKKINEFFPFNEFLRVRSRTYVLIKSLATDRSRDFYLADKELYQQTQTDIILDNFSARSRT